MRDFVHFMCGELCLIPEEGEEFLIRLIAATFNSLLRFGTFIAVIYVGVKTFHFANGG